MAARIWFNLDGVEIANTNRVTSHLGREVPTSDLGIFDILGDVTLIEDPPGSGLYLPTLDIASPGTYHPTGLTEGTGDEEGLYYDTELETELLCALEPDPLHPGLLMQPETSYEVGNLLAPPDGARQWVPGIYAIDGRCWGAVSCRGCDVHVSKNDGWDGLREFLGDTRYRPELAPWYSSRVPESAEFVGVWVMKVDGLDATPLDVTVTEVAGDGGVASKSRVRSRKLKFEALLIACTDAGLTYGMEWLSCQLRRADRPEGVVMRYFAANPTGSTVDPSDLIREAHGVVLTQEPSISDQDMTNVYRVEWELTLTAPHIYYPRIDVEVEWSDVTLDPINWVHANDCVKPEHCSDMPVLFSVTCEPEVIPVVVTPPPVCGGCMPVCGVERYTFPVPTRDYPLRCHETAVNVTMTNLGAGELTVQGYWRICGTDVRCDDNQFPLQISGLPPTASITLDSVSGTFFAMVDGVAHQAIGIVATPTGAPWRPTIIDRATCWEFVVIAPPESEFSVSMTLADRLP